MIDLPKKDEEYLQCLHQIKVMKQVTQGFLKDLPYDDCNCFNCLPENQSSILCHHYVNIEHMKFFYTLHGRTDKIPELERRIYG